MVSACHTTCFLCFTIHCVCLLALFWLNPCDLPDVSTMLFITTYETYWRSWMGPFKLPMKAAYGLKWAHWSVKCHHFVVTGCYHHLVHSISTHFVKARQAFCQSTSWQGIPWSLDGGETLIEHSWYRRRYNCNQRRVAHEWQTTMNKPNAKGRVDSRLLWELYYKAVKPMLWRELS